MAMGHPVFLVHRIALHARFSTWTSLCARDRCNTVPVHATDANTPSSICGWSHLAPPSVPLSDNSVKDRRPPKLRTTLYVPSQSPLVHTDEWRSLSVSDDCIPSLLRVLTNILDYSGVSLIASVEFTSRRDPLYERAGVIATSQGGPKECMSEIQVKAADQAKMVQRPDDIWLRQQTTWGFALSFAGLTR